MSLLRVPILRHGLTTWDKTLISPAEIERRLARVRAAMAAAGFDVLLAYGDMARGGDLAYLTNFQPFDARMPGFALVTASVIEALLKIASRDLTYVSRFVWAPAQSSDFLADDLTSRVRAVVEREGLTGKRVGLAGAAALTPKLRREIEGLFAAGTVRDAQPLLAALRREKSAAERAVMRLAASKAETVLARVVPHASEVRTELELAAFADFAGRAAGAQDVELLVHAAGDPPDARPAAHLPFRPPGTRALPSGAALGLYLALQVHGYWVEATETAFVGEPGYGAHEAYAFARAAFEELAADPRAAARESSGDGPVSAWVHGTGLDRDEGPYATPAGTEVAAGDVVAAHVMVRRDDASAFFGRTLF